LQRQRFDLPADGSGSLLLVDWTTAGRMERGEAWQFQRFATSNEVRGTIFYTFLFSMKRCLGTITFSLFLFLGSFTLHAIVGLNT
jgi:hypothetical protein